MTGDPLPLAQALIRCASVTPADAGAQDVLAALRPGLTPEMAAAVSKLMRLQDLVAVAAKCHVVTRFRNTIGLPGRLSVRLQPNHPTDDPRGVAASTLDGLLLAPVPRGAVFLGKLIANLAFVGAVEAITLPLFVLFFNVDLGHALPGLLGVTVLATIGFVAVGTLFSAMAVRTRFAELMLPVLLLPFMVPPLIGAVQVTARLLADRPLSEMLGWLRLLALYDVVFVTICTMAFASVVDE